METYLTIDEMAGYLKLAEQTIRRWVMNQEIPYHKIKKVIRFRVSDIERWIDKGGLPVPEESHICAQICANEGADEGNLFEQAVSQNELAEPKQEETGL